jgi:hypothetical protein
MTLIPIPAESGSGDPEFLSILEFWKRGALTTLPFS